MKYCHKCHNSWEGLTQPGIRETCLKCNSDMHVCLNCRFYNIHKPNQCEVNDVEAIIDKEKANFCEDFQFIDSPSPTKGSGEADKAYEQWQKLFKKKP
ncbi:MAG: hypothetical protein JW871_05390 [Endomicrobiales bacterium]|nr:hypothetical protein [Endomicrobiales bacterium]